MLDYHVIMDLLPVVATLFFQRRLAAPSSSTSGDATEKVENIHLSAVQSAILLGVGLQRKSVEDVEVSSSSPFTQLLSYISQGRAVPARFANPRPSREGDAQDHETFGRYPEGGYCQGSGTSIRS